MTWECQGRQKHGWFGHGSCGGEGADRAVAIQVGFAAIGHLASSQHRTFESWLHRSGVDSLTTVLPAWERGADLRMDTFRTRFFGDHAQPEVAAYAQEVGALLARAPDGPEGDALRLDAGRAFADLVQEARVEAIGPVMATAVRQAAQAPTRPAPSRPTAPAAPRNETPQQRRARIIREQNIRQLATVMYHEARAEGTAAMTAVGFTLRNRLARSNEENISGVWSGYNHNIVPGGLKGPDAAAWATAQQIARDIIDGKLADPTQGATHFYSPNTMPSELQSPVGSDAGGGLEDVPGSINQRDNQHHQNYRPRFGIEYPQIIVPNVPEPYFKFFKAPENVRFGRRRFH